MTTQSDNKETASFHGPNLILDVENFGPIAEAKNIEFKPMTVFVGPSNTGKTYLATLFHAFMRRYNPEQPSYAANQRGLSPRVVPNSQNLAGSMLEELQNFAKTSPQILRTDAPQRSNLLPIELFSETFRDEYRRFVLRTLNRYSTLVSSFVLELFEAESLSQLSTHGISFPTYFPRVTCSRRSGTPFTITLDEIENTCDISGASFNIPRRIIDEMRFGDSSSGIVDLDKTTYYARSLVEQNALSLFDDIPYSFYFPTGRTGIMNGHRVFTSNIMDRAFEFGIDGSASVTYHLLARDFLRLVVGLRQRPFRRRRRTGRPHNPQERNGSECMKVANIIERAVVKGQVRNVDSPGLPDFEYKQGENITPMFRASSMVTELAPIVMFLKNYVAEHDLLIIDEPEAHLHPEAQQQMAAALAFMVRSGLRVLITTHSHYMVEQLSNFVMASSLDDSVVRKRLLDVHETLAEEDVFLYPHEIAVYDFAPQSPPNGSLVNEVVYEDGYYPEDHIRAIGAQFNRNNRIENAVVGPE